jgi:hypothetical protein
VILFLQLVDVYEDEKYLHLVTELCTGGEMFDRIIAKTKSSEGHYSERDAATIMRKILDAIDYCHTVHNICHRCVAAPLVTPYTTSATGPLCPLSISPQHLPHVRGCSSCR